MIKWFEEHNKISWAITIIGAILIFYFSSIEYPIGIGKSSGTTISIIYHFFAFLLFGFFMFISTVRGKRKELFFLAFLVAVLYGVLDEVHQLYVQGRFFSFGDIFVDSIGVMVGFLIYFGILYFRE